MELSSTPPSDKVSIPFKKTNFSRNQLLAFVLVFAAIGGYLLFRTFAAAPLVLSVEGENMVPQASLSTVSSTNLALNRPATASSTQKYNGVTYLPSNAFDGNKSTRWSSNYSDPQWLQVDLGGTHAISQVVLRWETAYGKAYRIQTSNDGSVWTTIYSTTTGTGGVNSLSVNGSGRYIRMYGTARGTQWGYSLYEMEVYGPSSTSNFSKVISDSSASNGQEMEIYSNGTITGSFNLASSVTSVTVLAKSTLCSGIGGAATIKVDGAQLLSATINNTSLASYSASTNLAAGSHALSISFTNDAYVSGVCDRNLIIDVSDFFGPDVPTNPAPTVTLSASPASVAAGSSSTLTWGSTNATSCAASGAWSGTKSISGSAPTGALNQSSTYSLTCTGAGGAASASATVSIATSGPDLTSGFFTSGSFWRQPIPSTATIDSNSSNWVNMILANTQVDTLHINHDYWTTTLYHASASTPKVTFAVTNSNKHINLPYQSAWVTAPSPDTDKAIAIIDDTNGCEYETQGFVASTRTIHAVRVSNVWTGSGAHAADAGVSGGELPTVGGLITPQQAASGVIKHALRWASPFNSPNYVMPGTRSDGTHAGGVPQGELMRLDPALNLSQLGLNSFQLMLAKALQTYGAYDSDSGAAFTVYVESSFDGSQYNNTNWAFPRAILSHLQFITPLYSGSPLMTNNMPGCSNPY